MFFISLLDLFRYKNSEKLFSPVSSKNTIREFFFMKNVNLSKKLCVKSSHFPNCTKNVFPVRSRVYWHHDLFLVLCFRENCQICSTPVHRRLISEGKLCVHKWKLFSSFSRAQLFLICQDWISKSLMLNLNLTADHTHSWLDVIKYAEKFSIRKCEAIWDFFRSWHKIVFEECCFEGKAMKFKSRFNENLWSL